MDLRHRRLQNVVVAQSTFQIPVQLGVGATCSILDWMSTVVRFGARATIRLKAGRRKSIPASVFPRLALIERKFN
jgi:hypothetical protein